MNYVCTACQSSFGSPKTVTPGSATVELLLYGLLFIPGLLYSSYRLANRRKVCPKCGASEFVGTDTPRGLAILADPGALMPGVCPGPTHPQ
jgi:hypothetical protein